MKPEARFIKSVHDQLCSDVLPDKMFNPMKGGTADVNYAGFKGELWIEYKWHPAAAWRHITPTLSPLQRAWLMKRWDRGREPWVVVGFPTGCVVLLDPAEWQGGIDRDKAQVLSKQELARRIETRCGLQDSQGLPSARGTSTP